MNNSDIIKALAKGVNPITGELISNDDLLSDPTIIRALYSAVEAMKSGNIEHKSSNNLTLKSATREDNNIKKQLPKNYGKAWDPSSKDELVNKFNNGSTASELAKYYERTLSSINGILFKEGLIEQDEFTAPPTTKQKQELNIKLGNPLNHGVPWDPQSLNELINKFKNGSTVAELSKYYDRSAGSIRSTLSKNDVSGELRDIKNKNSNLPKNYGKPWSGILKEELFDKFRSGSSIPVLAKYFERTEGSIGGTLFDKGLINKDQFDSIYRDQTQSNTKKIMTESTKNTSNSDEISSTPNNEVSYQDTGDDPNFPFKL
jgi:Mor family transcriptional regulator